MIPWLDSNSPFPPLATALTEPDGLLAAGADLSPSRLTDAYRQGIFPWYNPGEPILWWSPDPRCVIYPDQLHISRSLRKQLRKLDYKVTFDQAFSDVMLACAAPRIQQQETWISSEMHEAYCELHSHGVAHSVEVWRDDELVGGLYGVAIGKVFFGESMFSRQRDTSKIAFCWMVEQLKKWDYALIDCQVHSDHLISLGAEEISRSVFANQLAENTVEVSPASWQFDLDSDWYEKAK